MICGGAAEHRHQTDSIDSDRDQSNRPMTCSEYENESERAHRAGAQPKPMNGPVEPQLIEAIVTWAAGLDRSVDVAILLSGSNQVAG